MSKIIYRFEDQTADGPYATLDFDHHGYTTHPLLQDDESKEFYKWRLSEGFTAMEGAAYKIGVPHVKQVFFGFSSVEQAHAWFDEADRKLMKAHGYNLVEYVVPEEAICEFGHQIVFDKSRAIKVESETQLSLELAA